MLQIVTRNSSVAKAQALLERQLARAATRRGRVHIGYQGGGDRYLTYALGNSGIWFACKRLSNRYWNAFGLGDPFEGTPTIVAEINPPVRGIRRSMAGAFAEDEDGAIYLVHRGNIGGGRRGVGKLAFLDNYSEPLQTLQEGASSSQVIVVGVLDQRTIVADIARFTKRVQSIKDRLVDTAGQTQRHRRDDHERDDVRPEFRGQKRYSTRSEIEANVTHGILVDALRAELANLGLKAFRTQSRDLYVPSKTGRQLDALFEIKTDVSSTSLYTAVGQLLMHGGAGKARRLVTVVPAELDSHRKARLREVGLRIVSFRWSRRHPIFTGLRTALA